MGTEVKLTFRQRNSHKKILVIQLVNERHSINGLESLEVNLH